MTQAKFFEEKEDYEEEEIPVPRKPGEAPDGGWGWMVVLGAFLCSLFVEGLLFSCEVLQTEISEYYEVAESSVKSIKTLMFVFSLLGGPFAGALVKRFGCRKVTWAGSALTCATLIISTRMPNLALLRLTYGVLTGFCLSLVYVPSIVIVSKWFHYKRAFATGLAVMGAGVGVFIFPPLFQHLLDSNDWKNATVIMAGLFLNSAVAGCLFRPLTRAKTKGMKRGVIQRGAIMKALIAEKERQRTISNGSLDNCIITKDNRLIKIDKIDLRNKSNSYINKLKETFGFSSRSLNRSKNSLVVPKVVVDPIYRPKPSPKHVNKNLKPKPASTPPTPKRDSGCGSLDSPNFKSRSYEELPGDDPWDKDTNLVVKLPSPVKNPLDTKVSVSESTLNNIDSPKKHGDEKLDSSFLSNNASPMGSGRSINLRTVPGSFQNCGKNIVLPVHQGSVMTIPTSVHSLEMSTIYEEEELTDCILCRKLCKIFDLMLLKSPTFWLLLVSSFFTMFGFIIPFVHLPAKAESLGISKDKSLFLISIIWVANMIGRFIVGWIADRPWTSAVQLNNVLLAMAGTLSFFMSMFINDGWLSFYAAFFGFFTAAFLALRSILLIELFGKDRLTGSMGLLIFCQGFAALAAFQLSGVMEGDLAFYMVAVSLVLAAFLGFPLCRVKAREEMSNSLKIVNIEEIPAQETLLVELCESSI